MTRRSPPIQNGPFPPLDMSRAILRALANTGISVLYQDRDLKVVWAYNVPLSWGAEPLTGKADSDFMPTEQAARMVAVKQHVLASRQPQSLEIEFFGHDDVYWYEMWVDADADASGDVVGLITTAVDISEQKQREQTLRALLREVSHRSKNLLAIIQAIATQTGRYAVTIDGFLTRFRGRIQSLASSQDLVTSSNWRGADLRQLVSGQVSRFTSERPEAVQVSGANPYLNPNAALHIGLALHELAVNSVSFGALSKTEGSVAIDGQVLGVGEDQSFVLTWREAVDTQGNEPVQPRFGTAALERVVPASLNGRSELATKDGYLIYRLHVPRSSFELY